MATTLPHADDVYCSILGSGRVDMRRHMVQPVARVLRVFLESYPSELLMKEVVLADSSVGVSWGVDQIRCTTASAQPFHSLSGSSPCAAWHPKRTILLLAAGRQMLLAAA
jgi:hypothetical protein